MSAAPAWVSFLSLGLSAIAVIIAWLSFRAGGPRLHLRSQRLPAETAGNPFPEGVPVELTVINSGRAAVTVEGFSVTGYETSRKPLVRVWDLVGEELPYRLEAHASASWVVDALPAAREVDRKSPGDDPFLGSAKFRFVVAAGNGRRARDSYTYSAVRLIAEANRDI